MGVPGESRILLVLRDPPDQDGFVPSGVDYVHHHRVLYQLALLCRVRL